MNIYRILTLSYGNSQSYIVTAYDAMQAMQNLPINYSELVRLELIGSENQINNTGGLR